MPPLEALSSQRHAGLYWHGFTDYHFAAKRALVPLVAAELPRALGALPLAFTCEQGRWLLVAVLGTQPQHNAFVNAHGQWQASYLPAYLRTQPFVLAQQPGGEYTVALDLDSSCVGSPENGGQPLFTDDAKPAEGLQRVLAYLRQLAQQRAATDAACQALDEAGILKSWPLTFLDKEGEEKRLKGLYRVSEASLKQLPTNVLSSLCRQGALSVAYAQLFSQPTVRELFQGSAVESFRANTLNPMDLSDVVALFEDDGEMRFNFEDR